MLKNDGHVTEQKVYDSFLSYAGEDTQMATELAGALKSRGFRIWYAPIDLSIGDNLLDSIEQGMVNSNSGILLISPAYLSKRWTNYEMDALIRQHIEGKKDIFPFLHNIEKSDVEQRHTGLGGIVALKTDIGLPELLARLTKALSKFAPTLGVIPCYESPKYKFLQGRADITIGIDGPATSIWEFLIHAKDSQYPIYLDGDLYSKEDLLLEVAQYLPHRPQEARRIVGEEGRKKIWDMCTEAGIDPRMFE